MFDFKLDALTTTALAVVLLLTGMWLKRRISLFERFCVPAPVIGGFAMALLLLIFRQTGLATFSFDTAMQTPLMVAFFTTVGIGGSLALLRLGGVALGIYLVICWMVSIAQNTLGAGIASLFGLDPVLGVMAGGVSLSGGHGTAAAFGPGTEAMGYAGATTVALASATFGLVAGALLGGPLANALIRYHNIVPASNKTDVSQEGKAFSEQQASPDSAQHSLGSLTSYSLMASLGLILILMVGGFAFVAWIKESVNFALPSFTGAMLLAIVFRNLNDRLHWVRLDQRALEVIGDLSLGIFLTMAMMSLKIWELVDLALPLLTILSLQVIIVAAVAAFVVFPLLGKNYDAAVMCAGLMGHGLGATPNAMANMSAVCERYGVRSYKAFLIVPLCGSVLLDIFAVPLHTWVIHYLH